MDQLRQGIHLRAYAQKQPKQEYKRESFELFQGLLDGIRRDVTRLLAQAKFQPRTPLSRRNGSDGRRKRPSFASISPRWTRRKPPARAAKRRRPRKPWPRCAPDPRSDVISPALAALKKSTSIATALSPRRIPRFNHGAPASSSEIALMAVNLAPLPLLLPVSGIRVGTVAAGIRKVGRPDLTVFELPVGAVTAAVFTQNRFCAAPVTLARRHREAAAPRYLLINTGNANAGTGALGLAAAEHCCQALAALAGVAPETVLPFSTG